MAWSTKCGTSLEKWLTWVLIGSESSDADAADERRSAEVDEQDRQPAREPPRSSTLHERVEDQRDHAGDDQDQQHRAGGARQRPEPEQRERQQHELDPARDDHRRDRRGASCRSASRLARDLGRSASGGSPAAGGSSGVGSARPRTRIARVRQAPPSAGGRSVGSLKRMQLEVCASRGRDRNRPASCSSATSSAASASGRCWRCCRRCASATRRTSWSSTARTPPAGIGITPKIADELFAAGVDVITLGNHTYRHREIYPYLDEHERILRPANFLRSQPGHGWCVVTRDGVRLGVVSLSGNLFMNAGRPAFAEADAALHALDGQGRPRARRHARRGDQREGRAWAGTSTAA